MSSLLKVWALLLAITVLAPMTYAEEVKTSDFVKSDAALDLVCETDQEDLRKGFQPVYYLELYYDQNSERRIGVGNSYIENSGEFMEDLVYQVSTDDEVVEGCEYAPVAFRFLDSGAFTIDFKCAGKKVPSFRGQVTLKPGVDSFEAYASKRRVQVAGPASSKRETAGMHCQFSTEE